MISHRHFKVDNHPSTCLEQLQHTPSWLCRNGASHHRGFQQLQVPSSFPFPLGLTDCEQAQHTSSIQHPHCFSHRHPTSQSQQQLTSHTNLQQITLNTPSHTSSFFRSHTNKHHPSSTSTRLLSTQVKTARPAWWTSTILPLDRQGRSRTSKAKTVLLLGFRSRFLVKSFCSTHRDLSEELKFHCSALDSWLSGWLELKIGWWWSGLVGEHLVSSQSKPNRSKV